MTYRISGASIAAIAAALSFPRHAQTAQSAPVEAQADVEDEQEIVDAREIVVQAQIGYRNRTDDTAEPVLSYDTEYFQRFEPLTAGDALKRVPSWLIASSQGDNAYALYRLPDLAPSERFRIAAGTLGATEETDGIAVELGDFGANFPGGLFVAQDGFNAPAQNFKLVPWAEISAVAASSPTP